MLFPGRPLVWGWYLDAVCEHLEAVTRGHIQKLLIVQPPNTLKSTFVSVLWPAWEWATDAGVRWLFAANEQGLATRDAGFCRELVASDWYATHFGRGWRMRPDSDEKTWYSTTAGGHRISLSTNARVTGKKGDRLVVDDPHDAKKVQSAADRAAVREWFGGPFLSRRADERTTPVVVAGQRVARDDLIGELKGQGDWVVLRLTEEFDPAARCVTPLWADPRTAPGEWLRPERFGPDERDKRVREGGHFVYHTQHNDDPQDAGGKMFDRAKAAVVRAVPQGTECVRYWDTAASEGDGACFSAGVLVGRTPVGRYLVLDAVRGRWTPHDRNAAMRQTAELDRRRPNVAYRGMWFEQEPGGSGKEVAQRLVRELAGLAVYADPVRDPKSVRAAPLSAQWQAGNVDLLEGGWNHDYLTEMDAFPAAKLKDYPDASSGAFSKLPAVASDGPATADPADTVFGSLPADTFR